MKITTTALDGPLILDPKVISDGRGFFLESYNQKTLRESGLDAEFVQDNHSRSEQRVLRGLHYQRLQSKLVSVVRGEILDVAVDIRPDSETFGQWISTRLSGDNHRQLFIPAGFAHGFAVISDSADIIYKVTCHWNREDEGGVAWNDPAIGIEWPFDDPVLSERDQNNPLLADIDPAELERQSGFELA